MELTVIKYIELNPIMTNSSLQYLDANNDLARAVTVPAKYDDRHIGRSVKNQLEVA